MQSAVQTAAQTPDWLVVVLGIGVVFVGLIALVVVCTLFGKLFQNRKPAASEESPAAASTGEIEHRGELVAAVSAALAEELGTDVKGLRILSIRRL